MRSVETTAPINTCCSHRLCAPSIVTDRIVCSVDLLPGEPSKNGCSDRHAVCVDDSVGPRETPVAYSGPIRGKYYIVFIQHNTAI